MTLTSQSLVEKSKLVRLAFPILARSVHNKPLVYLDSAATTQRPQVVIDAVSRFYEAHNANVHRGVHQLSQEATECFEGAREKVRAFMGAATTDEIVFTRGTTEAINLVAQSYARPRLGVGDEILVSEMEHHSNIVPWQMVCEQTGAKLKVIPIDDRGQLDMAAFAAMVGEKTALVAVNHISNALGTINPVAEIIAKAHDHGAVVVVDGAQAMAHIPVDVQALGADFYAMSGHKMYAPTGIGVLYGRRDLLQAMPPYQGGGDMIKYVTFEKTLYNDLPYKFEAGTPNIGGAVGLGAACDYLSDLGFGFITEHEQDLLAYGTQKLMGIDGLRMIGSAEHKAAVFSFELGDIHPHDVGTILDHEGVAVRTGHHCAQPVMQHFNVPATIRASLGIYNNRADIDALVAGLEKVREVFQA